MSPTIDGRDDRGRNADEPTALPAAGWKDVLLRVKEEYKRDHVALSAAAIAFHAFLALAPLMIAMLSIYGLFADPSNITALVDRLGSSVPSAVSDVIEQQLTAVVDAGTGALGLGVIIGLVAALWTASSGVAQLMEALNIAYDEDVDQRPFWKRRGIAVALTLLIMALLAVVGTVITLALGRSGALGVGLTAVAAIVSAAVTMAVLAVIYRYASDRDPPEWSWVSVGAVIAVVGWLIASALFTLYVSNFGAYNETYGTLGAVVVVLLWMYISALVIVIGAEINAELEHQTARDTTSGDERPIGSRDAYVADTVGRARR